MPYITQVEREGLEEALTPVLREFRLFNRTAGQLNYVVTKLIHAYIKFHGRRYSTMNDVIGVLECAKQELYRRQVALLEDDKINENGDVRVSEKELSTITAFVSTRVWRMQIRCSSRFTDYLAKKRPTSRDPGWKAISGRSTECR